MSAKFREKKTKTVGGVAIWKKFDDTPTDRQTDWLTDWQTDTNYTHRLQAAAEVNIKKRARKDKLQSPNKKTNSLINRSPFYVIRSYKLFLKKSSFWSTLSKIKWCIRVFCRNGIWLHNAVDYVRQPDTRCVQNDIHLTCTSVPLSPVLSPPLRLEQIIWRIGDGVASMQLLQLLTRLIPHHTIRRRYPRCRQWRRRKWCCVDRKSGNIRCSMSTLVSSQQRSWARFSVMSFVGTNGSSVPDWTAPRSVLHWQVWERYPC